MAIASCPDVYAIQRMRGRADVSPTLNVYGHLWGEGLDTIPNARTRTYPQSASATSLERSAARSALTDAMVCAPCQSLGRQPAAREVPDMNPVKWSVPIAIRGVQQLSSCV